MKVTMLGTGSIYSKSNCASIIIDNSLLIDLGPGVVKQLIKQDYDLTKIESILITHLHSDHILDFPTYIVNVETLELNHKVSIYCPSGTKEKFLSILAILYGDYFDDFISEYFNFIDISNNKLFIINNYQIKVKQVLHTGIESYGFLINSRLGVTGDSALCDSINQIYNESKVLICDCSLITGDKYHMGIDDIKRLLKIDNKKKIILTHFRDSTKNYVKKMDLSNVLIVEDGYSFSLEI